MLLVRGLAKEHFGADGKRDELLDFAPAVVNSARRHDYVPKIPAVGPHPSIGLFGKSGRGQTDSLEKT
ncbi:hypothetical protein DBZ45_07935 [Arthrobacter globiformis]|uniref:Uncharacterized protein n=1 Tax=Arthrobacter globiformis TaxID=1665 RepID=A0A328HH35_ARTGO|nr:hypothetical protein DBZ45_07935 [Arthrobacter globiformis]